MAALTTLLAYEEQIEPAWVQILRTRGVNAFVEFSPEVKESPFVDVTIVHVAPTGHQHIANWDFTSNTGQLYWDAWNARLFCKIYTQRGKNSDQQAGIMGTVRAAAADFQLLFTRSVLPYHFMENFKEAEDTAMARGYDKEFNLDWSEIRFDLTFSIRSDAW